MNHSKAIRLGAVVATCLLIVSVVYALLKRPAVTQAGPPKRPTGVVSNSTPGKKQKAEAPCKIQRAAFGGTQSALLKVTKGRFVHYVVLDRPTGNPMMPFYQRDWLEANYGEAQPAVVGEFPTVEEAIARAGMLCRRN